MGERKGPLDGPWLGPILGEHGDHKLPQEGQIQLLPIPGIPLFEAPSVYYLDNRCMNV